ncbi:MAG: caspase family protein, partial [Nostocales cyanobacterium 94392]|nr:caspase family protein [Nostocales cyanobacterium 94392]
MPRVNRRHFLQFAGSTLAALGLSQFDIIRQANRYGQVLAQDTPRKLALLVGINNYQAGISPLRGCLTDVEMQRELLLHRFGFNPQDIITLTDEKANRQNILDTFENHLIKQAKPGDVVVFHFSGHGSQVIDPEPISEDGLNSTMIPYDRFSQNSRDAGKVQDIMGRTLFLLMYALQTENVTVMLDSCHSGGGTRGNLVVRAVDTRLDGKNAQASPEEFEYQKKWLSRLKLDSSEFQELRRKGIAKGVALGSAQRDQLALDAPFDGFHAGAFTYLLTRYLWQQSINQSVETTFVNLQRSTEDVAKSENVNQVPQIEVKSGSNHQQKPTYFLNPTRQTAEAVVRSVKNEQIEFWLGGVSSESLESFTKGAIFSLIDAKGTTLAEIEQTSRVGMVGYGKLSSGQRAVIQPGALLRERIRGVPTDLSLRIGIDASLSNKTEIARKELQKVDRVKTVAVNQEQDTDFILGKMTSGYLKLAQQEKITPLPPEGSIGLFSSGLIPIPDSFGIVGESVDAAIQRLQPKFKMLLAGLILRSVLNKNTSSLKVTADIKPVGTRGDSSTVASRGAEESGILAQKIQTTVQTLKPKTEIKIHVTNKENRNLYIAVLVIDSSGNIVLLYPADYDSPEDASLVAPGKELVVPPITANPQNDFKFIVQGPSGFLELLVLASTEPLRNALRGLKQ